MLQAVSQEQDKNKHKQAAAGPGPGGGIFIAAGWEDVSIVSGPGLCGDQILSGVQQHAVPQGGQAEQSPPLRM